jgi:hypothetical protein
MPDNTPDVTLGTVHDALTAGFGEMRAGFADLKATLITGFGNLPTRESSEAMVQLLRENNRLQAERLTQLDVRSREQDLATQHVLHSLADSHQRLIESHDRLAQSHDRLAEEQRLLTAEQRHLSREIRALIARIDAIIRHRDNGGPAPTA